MTRIGLGDLLRESDFVVIAAPHTPETEKLPVDAAIIGIVDTVNVENRTIFSARE